MISGKDVYHIVEATVPLYVAMILAYLSLKWLKLFTPDQCAGINKLVSKFSIPLLSFEIISANNPYKMNLKLIISDIIQKLLALALLSALAKLSPKGNFKWVITGLSLSTLPNTLILGIPIIKAMYKEEAEGLLAQIIVLQSIIWYNLLLIVYEFNAAISASTSAAQPSEATGRHEDQESDSEARPKTGTGREVKIMLILSTVARKLMQNPNTHATLLGLIWACIHFKWGVKLPEIIENSIKIISSGGLGMAMFSLGLFMASRSSIIAGGIPMLLVTIAAKFILGPVLMAASSAAIGLRSTVLKVAIVQAALPQGIVPFVFAKEYDVHPDIVSTGVIFGMLIALPVALAYYLPLAAL
ncbi:auxin efflux carrier component 8 [Tripterygium wilfordii]|uniref:auxin efflux carrier component 8 n=1 Tax=Tripterygium wilfordii TaxID=458696 RepID=UPI0018F85620|nr:auxin efflux carrier component 8 [Tripterygium wilfordii]